MRVIVICVFQILQMLVNHIGGWKCTLGHKRNTLPGGSGIQSRLQLSTFEYFTRKPTLELNYFEFNSIFEYFYLNPIHNSSIMNMDSLLSWYLTKKPTLELKPLHEITAIALFCHFKLQVFSIVQFVALFVSFCMEVFSCDISRPQKSLRETKNSLNKMEIFLWGDNCYCHFTTSLVSTTELLSQRGINPTIKFIVPLKWELSCLIKTFTPISQSNLSSAIGQLIG